jgi:hypothetical protein
MLIDMAKSTLVSGIAMLVVACGALRHADAATGPDAVMLTLADLKWIENPERPGTWQAAAEGDPDTGPAHFYTRYAKGYAGGLHSHTSDHGGWIIAGTVILVIDGKETRLPPRCVLLRKGWQAPHRQV